MQLEHDEWDRGLTSSVEGGHGSMMPRDQSPLKKPDLRIFHIWFSDWLLPEAHRGKQSTLDTLRMH